MDLPHLDYDYYLSKHPLSPMLGSDGTFESDQGSALRTFVCKYDTCLWWLAALDSASAEQPVCWDPHGSYFLPCDALSHCWTLPSGGHQADAVLQPWTTAVSQNTPFWGAHVLSN